MAGSGIKVSLISIDEGAITFTAITQFVIENNS